MRCTFLMLLVMGASGATAGAAIAQAGSAALLQYQQAHHAGDRQAALRYLQQAAASGNADAEAELANVYRGTITDLAALLPRDPAKAFALTQDAVAKGSTRAVGDLALAYYTGDGVRRDYGVARERFQRAVRLGNRKAYRYLGLIYQNGLGTPVDSAKALGYYRQGADGGDITSQCLLGTMYEAGSGVAADPEAASRWYAKSAERGDMIASGGMAALGRLCETRTDGKQSVAAARQWYGRAAAQGNAAAGARLASLDGPTAAAPSSAVDLCIGPSHH